MQKNFSTAVRFVKEYSKLLFKRSGVVTQTRRRNELNDALLKWKQFEASYEDYCRTVQIPLQSQILIWYFFTKRFKGALKASCFSVTQLNNLCVNHSWATKPLPSAPSETRGEAEILSCLLTNEVEYDSNLKVIVQELLPAFHKSEMFLANDILVLFGNVEDIFDFHHSRFGPELFRRLRSELPLLGNRRETPAAVTAQTHALRFAQLFIDYTSSFDSYFTYIQSRPKSEAFILVHSDNIKAVLGHVGKTLDDLQNLLRVPTKRLDEYQDALESLFKITVDERILRVLQKGLNVVSRQFRYGEALWALEKISNGGVNLTDQLLFRIDDLTVKKEYHLTGRAKFRCVFLFTKCIIITKRLPRTKDSVPLRKGGDFGDLKFKGHIDFQAADKCGISGLLRSEPLFKIFHQCNEYLADVYAFKADTMEVRDLWVKDICEVLGLQTHLQIKPGEFRTSFLKAPSLSPRRFRLNYIERTEALKRSRLIRHSWPRHIIQEVEEAKDAREFERRRRSIESNIMTSRIPKSDRILLKKAPTELLKEKMS